MKGNAKSILTTKRQFVTQDTGLGEDYSREGKEMTLIVDKKRRRDFARRFFMISLVLLVPFSLLSWAGVAFPIENDACLECHGKHDILQMSKEERLQMVIPTPGKEEVRKGGIILYVDYEQFRSTVHRELNCIDCHTDIKSLPHPQRLDMVNGLSCPSGGKGDCLLPPEGE
jgi:hypothetical protein